MLDNKLIKTVNVLEGLVDNGIMVINTPNETFQNRGKAISVIAVADATRIALETIGEPITNMAMLGAFSKATEWVTIKAISQAIKRKFHDPVARKNIEAAKMAYKNVQLLR